MTEIEDEREIKDLIRDYLDYKSLAETNLRTNPHHTFRDDLCASILMCDKMILKLNIKLRILKLKKRDQNVN